MENHPLFSMKSKWMASLTSLHIILLVIALSAAELAFGQDYVLLANGESLKGHVTSFNQTCIKFRRDSQDKSMKLTADQIDHLQTGNRIYYSKKIITVNTKEAATISQLLRVVSWGRIKVYKHMVRSSRYRIGNYYLEKDDSGLILVGTSTGSAWIRNDNYAMLAGITKEVENLFADHPDLNARFIADGHHERGRVILKFVQEYNQSYQASNSQNDKTNGH